MSQILAGQEGVQCYLDDIIVYASSPEKHEERLQAVLNCIDQAGIMTNVISGRLNFLFWVT